MRFSIWNGTSKSWHQVIFGTNWRIHSLSFAQLLMLLLLLYRFVYRIQFLFLSLSLQTNQHFNGAIIIFSIFRWTCKLFNNNDEKKEEIPFAARVKTLERQSIVFEIRCAVLNCVLDAFTLTQTQLHKPTNIDRYSHSLFICWMPFLVLGFLNSSSHLSQFYLI